MRTYIQLDTHTEGNVRREIS